MSPPCTPSFTSHLILVPTVVGPLEIQTYTDHKVKKVTQDQDPTPDPHHHMDLVQFELSIIVHNMIYDPNSVNPNTVITFHPIYGDLRVTLTHNLKNNSSLETGPRDRRGDLFQSPSQILPRPS